MRAALRLLAAGCLAGCVSPPEAAIPTEEATPLPRSVVATGRVEGWREADVAAKIPGRVLRLFHDEGEVVPEAEPVAVLDDVDLRARVREAEARADEAALRLGRVRALWRDGFVATSELDRAEAEHATGVAALEQARAVLAYATLRAPFAGTILHTFKEVGEGVRVDGLPDPVFRIADLSQLLVRAEVPERDVGAVSRGQAATVTSEPYPGTVFRAAVARVGLSLGRKKVRSDDPRARLDEKVLEVELALDADPRLRPGLTVDVRFGNPPPNDR